MAYTMKPSIIEMNKQLEGWPFSYMKQTEKQNQHIEAFQSEIGGRNVNLYTTSTNLSSQTPNPACFQVYSHPTSKLSMVPPPRVRSSDPPYATHLGQKLFGSIYEQDRPPPLSNKMISKNVFPKFDGTLLREWFYRCDQFFGLHNTPPESKVCLASLHLVCNALQWHHNFMRDNYGIFPSWLDYIIAISARFGELSPVVDNTSSSWNFSGFANKSLVDKFGCPLYGDAFCVQQQNQHKYDDKPIYKSENLCNLEEEEKYEEPKEKISEKSSSYKDDNQGEELLFEDIHNLNVAHESENKIFDVDKPANDHVKLDDNKRRFNEVLISLENIVEGCKSVRGDELQPQKKVDSKRKEFNDEDSQKETIKENKEVGENSQKEIGKENKEVDDANSEKENEQRDLEKLKYELRKQPISLSDQVDDKQKEMEKQVVTQLLTCMIGPGDMGDKKNGHDSCDGFYVYLEPWSVDLSQFLELRKNHGKEERMAKDLFYAPWVSWFYIAKDSMWYKKRKRLKVINERISLIKSKVEPYFKFRMLSNVDSGSYLVFDHTKVVSMEKIISSSGNDKKIENAKGGHDLLIRLNSGDVFIVSLSYELQNVPKKLVGALHHNKDMFVNSSLCTRGDGSFVVAHAEGNLDVYEKSKNGVTGSIFFGIRDTTHLLELYTFARIVAEPNKPLLKRQLEVDDIKDVKFLWDEDNYLQFFWQEDSTSYNFAGDEHEEEVLDKEKLMEDLLKFGAFLLTKMKETIEVYVGKSVKKVVVTVPAYFNNVQSVIGAEKKDQLTKLGHGLLFHFEKHVGTNRVNHQDLKGKTMDQTSWDFSKDFINKFPYHP